MSSEDVILPRHVTGSCYAKLTQIYIDIFKVPPTSNLWTSNQVKKKITYRKRLLSLGAAKKSEHSFDSIMRNSGRYFHKSEETFVTNQRHQICCHLGETKQIADGKTVLFTTKF